MKTIILAHYYTTPQVQQLANFVGDSLFLSQKASETNASRIVFAGVQFMAETAKLLNPQAEVILPNPKSTCSLVTMIDEASKENSLYKYISDLKQMTDIPFKVITYINSSTKLKAYSDIIVTSSNVEDIINSEILKGNRVLFTPDRNMGAYLEETNPEWGDMFDYWKGAVCEVHDRFTLEALNQAMNGWTDGKKYLIAHPEAPLPVLRNADLVGSTSKMLSFIKDFKSKYATIFVATESGLLYNMRKIRPDLDIRQAPLYSGCKCADCPYMKFNTEESIRNAIDGIGGKIIEIPDKYKYSATQALNRMLEYD